MPGKTVAAFDMVEPAKQLSERFETAAKTNEVLVLSKDDLERLAIVFRWLSQEPTKF